MIPSRELLRCPGTPARSTDPRLSSSIQPRAIASPKEAKLPSSARFEVGTEVCPKMSGTFREKGHEVEKTVGVS